MRRQAQLAIEMADVVVLMTNVKDGVTANDQDVAQMLLKAKKKIVLAVNKVDNTGDPPRTQIRQMTRTKLKLR